MSDASKAHKLKLANSRKRFKELQEQKKKKNINASLNTVKNDIQEQTPADSLTSSTHSSVNAEITLENTNMIKSQLPNYFNTTTDNVDNSIFFDSLSHKNDNIFIGSKSDSIENVVPYSENTLKLESQISKECDIKFKENIQQIETQQIFRPNSNIASEKFDDMKPNELEFHKNCENNIFSEVNRQNLINYLQVEVQDDKNNETIQNVTKAVEGGSNADSLRQLSNQTTHLESQSYVVSESITDLEKRNIELSSFLEEEKLLSQQHVTKINDLQSQINQLELESRLKEDHALELKKLKEELQCHGQTIRVLVAEKTELSNNLSDLESNYKSKNSECDELQARLKASRSRAFELEQELNSLKSDRMHKETNGHDQDKIIENLRRDFNNLRDENEELKQDLLEVKEKLKSVTEEKLILQKSNHELSNKLSLADVKIQQFTNADDQSACVEVEKLIKEKIELEKEVVAVNSILNSVTKERNESTSQYQHYTEELNLQLVNLQEQYQQLQQENENLSAQELSRVKHISDLERQLQGIQNERMAFSSNPTIDSKLKNELDVAKEICIQLQWDYAANLEMEKNELEENCTKALNEKEMLLKELSAKNDSLSQLESMVEQLRGNQPDSVKLLATMESDKVAAARAVQQNKELKEQLESMKEVFVKMDNDKVELTEKLSLEQSSNRDLLDKLQKTELQLQRLTDAIEIKDRELSHLREVSADLNKQVLQQEQLADRLRHYEAHDNSSHFLQNELQETKQTVVRLTNEINQKNNQNNSTLPEENQDVTEEDNTFRKQLKELENRELISKLKNHALDDNCNNTQQDVSSALGDGECILKNEEAMTHLEDKVKKTMQDIADLTEEKQRLEHLVMQLQSETETIGEYVALYQHQRMILKQKAVEKDEQLKQLATDREQIKVKLEKLKQLVVTLLNGEVVNSELIINEKLSEMRNSKEINRMTDTAVEEIMALLSEIKTSNLVEPKENVHHCSFCSGQLITI